MNQKIRRASASDALYQDYRRARSDRLAWILNGDQYGLPSWHRLLILRDNARSQFLSIARAAKPVLELAFLSLPWLAPSALFGLLSGLAIMAAYFAFRFFDRQFAKFIRFSDNLDSMLQTHLTDLPERTADPS